MPYLQKNKIPPNQILTLTLRDYSGGLNNRSDLLHDNESSDIMNMAFSSDITMQKRYGIDYYDGVTLARPILHVSRYEPYNAASILMRASDLELFADNVKIADLTGSITAKNYMGKFVFADGTSLRQFGKFPQVADTHTVIVGTPVATNIVMKVVDPPVGYTPLATTETRGKYGYNYTNMTTWYEPCANEMTDTYKGASVMPLNPKYVEVHGDRLFVSSNLSDKNTVFITDIANLNYFPVYLPIQMPPNSDVITGLKTFHDTVVVGRKRDLHVIYGNTNRTTLTSDVFQLKHITSHTGFANQNSIDLAHNYLFFIGYDGNAYALSSTKSDVDLLSTQILNNSIDFFTSPINCTSSDISNTASVFFNDEWHVSMGDKVAVYNYRHKGWTLYKYQSFTATSFYVDGYALKMGGNIGRVVVNTIEYKDLGSPYKAYFSSKRFDMGDPSSYKQIREFYIVAKTFTTFNSDITVRFEIDYVDVLDTFTISNQISIWGKAKFGDRFINRNINASLPIVIGRRGRYIRIICENSYFLSGSVTNYSDLAGYANLKEGTLVYVTSLSKYYLYTDSVWVEKTDADLNQPMCVTEINGQYEFRGKR